MSDKITIFKIDGTVLCESKTETVKEQAQKNYRNLRGADLSSADLRGADLSSADLYGANLSSANLRGADLSSADLRGANLSSANLRGANLSSADLSSANLYGANLSSANLRGANLSSADLSSADLRGADLSSADLYGAKNLPQWYINVCARDLLFVFEHLKNELPGLREKLVQGKVNGTQYEGDCACLIGSLANIQDKSTKEVCNYLPFYDMGLHNYGEQWFWNIKEGDTPESNEFSKQAVFLIDMVLAKKPKIAIKKAK